MKIESIHDEINNLTKSELMKDTDIACNAIGEAFALLKSEKPTHEDLENKSNLLNKLYEDFSDYFDGLADGI